MLVYNGYANISVPLLTLHGGNFAYKELIGLVFKTVVDNHF